MPVLRVQLVLSACTEFVETFFFSSQLMALCCQFGFEF